MKNWKKLLVFMLAFAMLFGAFISPFAVKAEEAAEEGEEAAEEPAEEGEEAEGEDAEEPAEEGEEAEGEDAEEPAEEEEELTDEEVAEQEMEELVDFEDIAEEGIVTNMQAWATSPANWNPQTSQTTDEGDFQSYFMSTTFTFNYDYDSGSWVKGLKPMPVSVAEMPTDVTEEYAGQYAVPEDATEGYAYKYVLRDDLMWEDGTPIDAHSYVYSMSQLLNPNMANHRASMFYQAAQVLHNAEKYVKQGKDAPMALVEYAAEMGFETVDELLEEHGDEPALINWAYSFGEMYADGEWTDEGIEDETVEAGLTIAEMKDVFIKKVVEDWGETEETALEFYEAETSVSFSYPEMDFSEVGFFATDDLEFVVVMDKPLIGFDFLWNCRDYYLVHEEEFEKAKVEQKGEDGEKIVTTTYNTTVEGTKSYGPYKLIEFQDDKYFKLEKNDNWFGWNVPELAEMYPADVIYAQIVKSNSTRYQMFLKGQLNNYALQPDEAEEYRGSPFIYYEPSDYTGSLNIQTNFDALKERETKGINKTILTIKEFRKALVWSIDRADYASVVTAASMPGFGLLNSMYIAEPEEMIPYRDYDAAKETLLRVYGVEYGEDKDYATLDEAYEAMTGYDLDGARENFDIAYDKAIEEGLMEEGDVVTLTFSFGQDNESTQRMYNYLNETWTKAVEGTKLEGKLVVDYDPTAGVKFGENFRNGISDLLIAGWGGARMDPFFFIGAYIEDQYRYAVTLDVDGMELEHEVDGETYTLSLRGWYEAMMGLDPDHPFGGGQIPHEERIKILALIESAVLEDYSSSPLTYGASAVLQSQRIEFESPDLEYHPILAFGKTYYLYDDAQWADYLAESDGFLDYH